MHPPWRTPEAHGLPEKYESVLRRQRASKRRGRVTIPGRLDERTGTAVPWPVHPQFQRTPLLHEVVVAAHEMRCPSDQGGCDVLVIVRIGLHDRD